MVRKLLKRAGVCLLSLSMVLTGNVGISGASTSSRKGAAVETKTGSIVIDGNDIKADNVNGLTYKGFGMLSANSTSDLLMDYKSQNPEAYAKLMQYLFGGEYPIFTHVKLEMGNDRNNSTGSESATKRTKGEKANVLRNPGWQLAADAKKINPNLKVSILTWRTPSWVKTDEDKYIWYKQSILDAYETILIQIRTKNGVVQAMLLTLRNLPSGSRRKALRRSRMRKHLLYSKRLSLLYPTRQMLSAAMLPTS